MVGKILYYKNAFLDYYEKNELMVSAIVFSLGFVFDLITLGRIDDLFNLIQQAVYIIILGALLIFEIKLNLGTFIPTPRQQKFWDYHDLIVHFLFGSLLSVYTIFYYTSASALTSLFFIVLLALLMLANEIPRIQKLGLIVRVILFSICVLSYTSFLYPILLGHVGPLPFWLGILTSMGFLIYTWKYNFRGLEKNPIVFKKVLLPALGVHLFFLFGYYFSLIPPVPVAVKKIGIYYDVQKTDGNYVGKYTRPFWKVWSKGSQEFLHRPGDKLNVLLKIFSPSRFQDQVFLKWYRDDEKRGWTLEDTIPLNILGGREEGFRGIGTKRNFSDGDWRVVVETSDGREVGRINLEILQDGTTDERTFKDDIF